MFWSWNSIKRKYWIWRFYRNSSKRNWLKEPFKIHKTIIIIIKSYQQIKKMKNNPTTITVTITVKITIITPIMILTPSPISTPTLSQIIISVKTILLLLNCIYKFKHLNNTRSRYRLQSLEETHKSVTIDWKKDKVMIQIKYKD